MITEKLLNGFTYTPSLLYELMKMIFIKSTGEHAYLDVYVRLCSLLFEKFNDKDNHEMNFKKLLVSKCQKQFFKMLNQEREERKKRRDSLTMDPTTVEGNSKEQEEEFSKTIMYLYDDDELKERKKDQMYGNMYLITELHIAGQLNGNIIKTCLEDLQQEINDQNIEIITYMLNKLMGNLCKLAKNEIAAGQVSKEKKQKSVINLEYVDNICQKVFGYRKHEALSSRIRFKVQDLIDAHDKEWRYVIAQKKGRTSDSEGFRQVYVPKDKILTEDQVFHGGSSRLSQSKKGGSNQPKG